MASASAANYLRPDCGESTYYYGTFTKNENWAVGSQDGVPCPAGALRADEDYVVSGWHHLQCRDGGVTSLVFGGKSLTIEKGYPKVPYATELEFPRDGLIFDGYGGLWNEKDLTLKGRVSFTGNTGNLSYYPGFYGAKGTTLRVMGPIVGGDKACMAVGLIYSGTRAGDNYTVRLEGDVSGFTGRLEVLMDYNANAAYAIDAPNWRTKLLVAEGTLTTTLFVRDGCCIGVANDNETLTLGGTLRFKQNSGIAVDYAGTLELDGNLVEWATTPVRILTGKRLDDGKCHSFAAVVAPPGKAFSLDEFDIPDPGFAEGTTVEYSVRTIDGRSVLWCDIIRCNYIRDGYGESSYFFDTFRKNGNWAAGSRQGTPCPEGALDPDQGYVVDDWAWLQIRDYDAAPKVTFGGLFLKANKAMLPVSGDDYELAFPRQGLVGQCGTFWYQGSVGATLTLSGAFRSEPTHNSNYPFGFIGAGNTIRLKGPMTASSDSIGVSVGRGWSGYNCGENFTVSFEGDLSKFDKRILVQYGDGSQTPTAPNWGAKALFGATKMPGEVRVKRDCLVGAAVNGQTATLSGPVTFESGAGLSIDSTGTLKVDGALTHAEPIKVALGPSFGMGKVREFHPFIAPAGMGLSLADFDLDACRHRKVVFSVGDLDGRKTLRCTKPGLAIIIGGGASGGVPRSVRASAFGWNATNATDCLLQAIGSGADRVIVDRRIDDWIVDPIAVTGRKGLTLELEHGVRIVARRGGFKGVNDSLFRFTDCDDLKIVGNGAELAMWKVDYTNAALYARSEWRHGIELRGCQGVEISDLRIVESGGDGIYIADAERTRRDSGNVVIRRVVCDGNNRQGMSVISVDGLLVEDSVFSNTCGAPPQSGVDLEPNGSWQKLKDVVFRGCEAFGNAGAGFEIAKWLLNETSEPVSVTFERCTSSGNVQGLGQFGVVQVGEQRARDMRGVIRYRDCVFTDEALTPDAFRYHEKGKANFRVVCENCIVRDPAAQDGRSRLDLDWGEPIGAEDLHGLALTRAALPGDVHVCNPDGTNAVEVSAPLFRGENYRFFVHAGEPGCVRFRMRQHPVGDGTLSVQPFVVTDAAGVRVAEMPAAGAQAEWRSFEAPKAGFYVIDVRLGGRALDITAISHPTAAIASGPHTDRLPSYFGRTGELFFCVPPGTGAFGVSLCGSGGPEKVSGRILDPSGTERARLANAGWESHFAEADPASGPWKIAFENPTEGWLEDFSADLVGLDPVFFLSDRKYWYPKSCCGESTVWASDFGWDAADATSALQAALDSGARRVIVDRQAGDWVVRPLFVRSNTEVVFEHGVVVRAKPDEFHGLNDCLFLLRDVENVTLRGEGGVVLRMERDDYADPAHYSAGEWRHALSIRNSRNIRASDLELRHSGGDGVYVCQSEDVDLRRLDVRDHYRQGISVISARRLYVGQCRFNDTRGTPPACGIDFEPNGADEYLVDCVLDDCEFAGNQYGGVLFHLTTLSALSEPVSVTARNCRLTGNASGLIVTAASNYQPPVKGRILIENCEIAGSNGRSATFNGLSASSVQVELRNCLLASKVTDIPDILLNNSDFSEDFAGLRFTDTVLRTANATPVSFLAAAGAGFASVDGTLTVERNGGSFAFDFSAFAAANAP